MSENLQDALGELKRADHMIFVSLKYTRTVDVIKNILQRLISGFEFTFDALAEYLKENKKIDSSTANIRRVDILKKYFAENKEFSDFLEFYTLMKKIDKANFTRRQEFRRHVTMTVILEDKGMVELNIDSIHEYYLKTKAFVDFAINMIAPRKDE